VHREARPAPVLVGGEGVGRGVDEEMWGCAACCRACAALPPQPGLPPTKQQHPPALPPSSRLRVGALRKGIHEACADAARPAPAVDAAGVKGRGLAAAGGSHGALLRQDSRGRRESAAEAAGSTGGSYGSPLPSCERRVGSSGDPGPTRHLRRPRGRQAAALRHSCSRLALQPCPVLLLALPTRSAHLKTSRVCPHRGGCSRRSAGPV
jgi:hypothetical protein